jgi:uncharacterized protein (DUF3084 family)
MPEHAASDPFVLRVEISAEQVPRLREALSASGNDGELARRAGDVAAREEQLRAEHSELEERARKLSEREAELGTSGDLTASERIRLAHRRESVELSERELAEREDALLTREAEFEADVMLREERIDRWRTELTALQEHLDHRERQLADYVDQLQGAVNGGSWPSPPGVSELRRTA